jgi:outer membrane protein assembly factor BamB
MLAIAPLWLMLAAVNTPVHAQTSDDVSSSAATASSPADWTQFHRDNMQRSSPYETVLGVNNVGSLQAKWKHPIGRNRTGEFVSSPAVVGGVVYVASDDDYHVYGLNAGSGDTLWRHNMQISIKSSPAVVNGVLYIGSEDNNVYALNPSTGGSTLWSYATGNPVDSSPTVVNGVVYVISNDDNVYSITANTGAKRWSYRIGRSQSSPTVANGVVYVGAGDNNVYALDANTGAKLWSFTTGSRVDSSPAVANGVVYVGSDDFNLYALNASTGARVWSYHTDVLSSPAVANGVVYFGSADHNLYAVNASTGAKLWSYATGNRVFSSPAVANGVVYVGSEDGNIYAFNAITGAKLWSYFTGLTEGGHTYSSSPSVVDGVVYILAEDFAQGNVYAFSVGADLFLRIQPSTTTVHQGDLLTYAFPVWNLGPDNADHEVLNTQVPAGTVFDYVRISGTPGLATCTHPPYGGTGQIICHEGDGMAPNTTWTVRLTVKVTAPAGTVITESAATLADTPDPNLANNTATVSLNLQ